MHSPETITLFRRLVQQQVDCAERLISALQTESQALTQQDAEALQRSAGLKQQLLQEMTRHVTAQEGFLASRRLPPGKDGIRRFLADFADDADEPRLWRRLDALARQCRDANEINGNIIMLSRVRVQRALEILHGSNNAAAKTYGREGETRMGRRSTVIGTV